MALAGPRVRPEDLRLARYRAGLSQREAEEAAALSRGYLGALEAGRRNGSVSTIHRLARVYGVDIEEIADLNIAS